MQLQVSYYIIAYVAFIAISIMAYYRSLNQIDLRLGQLFDALLDLLLERVQCGLFFAKRLNTKLERPL